MSAATQYLRLVDAAHHNIEPPSAGLTLGAEPPTVEQLTREEIIRAQNRARQRKLRARRRARLADYTIRINAKLVVKALRKRHPDLPANAFTRHRTERSLTDIVEWSLKRWARLGHA